MAEKQEILRALRGIQRDEKLPNTAKYLLLLLALHGEWRNGGIARIFPGETLLARQAGYHETTIRRWLAWLKREEYLVLDGRKSNNRYSHVEQYIIFDARFEPGYQKGDMGTGDMEREEKPRKTTGDRPKGGPRKMRLEPTDTPEPPQPVIPRGDPEPEPEPPADAPSYTFDADALRERRAKIQQLIAKARSGDRAASWWWEKEGANAMQTLEAINQLIGIDVEVPVG